MGSIYTRHAYVTQITSYLRGTSGGAVPALLISFEAFGSPHRVSDAVIGGGGVSDDDSRRDALFFGK